jgi:hypothetical protein
MRKFPVGKLKESRQEHLGVLINRIVNNVLRRPFLEKWNGPFRAWWVAAKDGRNSPYEIQNEFPDVKELLADWRHLRRVMRKVEQRIRDEYKLIPVDQAPAEQWIEISRNSGGEM